MLVHLILSMAFVNMAFTLPQLMVDGLLSLGQPDYMRENFINLVTMNYYNLQDVIEILAHQEAWENTLLCMLLGIPCDDRGTPVDKVTLACECTVFNCNCGGVVPAKNEGLIVNTKRRKDEDVEVVAAGQSEHTTAVQIAKDDTTEKSESAEKIEPPHSSTTVEPTDSK